MKLFILILISLTDGYFTGCPMDGCESTLSGFVDINVDGFDDDVKWKRYDLLTNSSRGCISNEQEALICVVDVGYASINVTSGQVLWFIVLQTKGKLEAVSLPIVNQEGFLIIANSTQCVLVDSQGVLRGIFKYEPVLIAPLAGPFITDDGQIIVADLVSFVGIEDSGIPLGVQALPPYFTRLSRSMSLNINDARWYLITQHNITSSQAIVAAETSGSIVDRLRIAWIYEYGRPSNSCNVTEGPLLSVDRKWLFAINDTGILIIADRGHSASIEYIVHMPGLCANNMAYIDKDSTLFIIDKHTYNIIVLDVSTKTISYISLSSLCQEEITGQLSRMTIIQNNRLILVAVTASRKAVLLLVDYNHQKLLGHFELGYVSNKISFEPLTQLAYTITSEEQIIVTVAHQAIGLIAVPLCMFTIQSIRVAYPLLYFFSEQTNHENASCELKTLIIIEK